MLLLSREVVKIEEKIPDIISIIPVVSLTGGDLYGVVKIKGVTTIVTPKRLIIFS